MAVTTADVVRFVQTYAATLHEQKGLLTRLDAAIGDADHGENMDRGFRAALERLPDPDRSTPADVLKSVATALISKVGGAAGPLYGTAFLRAATSLGDAGEIDAGAAAGMIRAARDGIVARGKAEVGDKTMVDAWTPATESAETAAQAGATPPEVLAAAANAAHAGAVATEPLIARKGRASYLGERSAGHQDPGAVSTALILTAAAAAAGGEVA